MVNRNNQNLKRIALALELDDRDIAQIAGVSRSLANGWKRSPEATKSGSGNTRAKTVSRYRDMSDAEFDDFCSGLVDWV